MEKKNSDARIAANSRYNAKAYDDIKVRTKKGTRTIIQDHAALQNESMQGYIKRAIKTLYKSETGKDIDL